MEIKCSFLAKKLVVSAFPGTGKSYYSNEHNKLDLSCQGIGLWADDLDSSNFHKIESESYKLIDGKLASVKSLKSTLDINEYIEAIERSRSPRVFVSTHEEVRNEMERKGIDYVLIYPKRELKEEYLQKYKDRGSPDSFVKMMDHKWDEFIDSCEKDYGHTHIVLDSEETINSIGII